MRTVSIKKESLKYFNYDDESQILTVWLMINVALDIVKDFNNDEDIVYTSLESIWDSITCGDKELNKKQSATLVDSLISLVDKGLITILTDLGDKPIKYTTKLKIKVKQFDGSFTCLTRKEIGKIFTQLKFTDINQALCTVFRIMSHANGNLYYKELKEVTDEFSHEYFYEEDNPATWMIGMKKEDLQNVKGLIWYPKKEDIIETRFNTDTERHQWITRPTLDKILKELERLKIISSFQTSMGVYNNKCVFCKTEHLEFVQKFYERVVSQAEYSSSQTEESVEVPQETPKVKTANGRRKSTRDFS